jgi:hypothetical protein
MVALGCTHSFFAWLNACKKYPFRKGNVSPRKKSEACGGAEAAMPSKPSEKNDSDKKAMNEQCFECRLRILE